MREKWMVLDEFPEYSISTLGRVRRDSTGRIRQLITSRGYAQTMLGKEKKNKSVHRLVGLTFLSNPSNLPQINHKNGDKLDNRVENLEWVTCKENIHHSTKMGLRTNPSGSQHWCCLHPELIRKGINSGSSNGRSKLDVKDVERIRSLHGAGVSQTQISKDVGISRSQVQRIVKGKRWVSSL